MRIEKKLHFFAKKSQKIVFIPKAVVPDRQYAGGCEAGSFPTSAFISLSTNGFFPAIMASRNKVRGLILYAK